MLSTSASAASKDILAVARRLGHTSTRMVDSTYVELYSEVSREIADAIDVLVMAAAGSQRDGTSAELGDLPPS